MPITPDNVNTIREKILSITEKKISLLDDIKTVQRKIIRKEEELRNFADTQFPIVTITGELPSPENDNSIELGAESYNSNVSSYMDINICVFGYNSNYPDSEISYLFNKIYKQLYYDPEFKGFDYTSDMITTVKENGIVFTTNSAVISSQRWNFYKTMGEIQTPIDLSKENYDDELLWIYINDDLESLTNYCKVIPVGVVEFSDPYFLFKLRYIVSYNHYTFET